MRVKKQGEYLHCYVRSDVISKLNDFCEDTGLSKTVTVEKALLFYIDSMQDAGLRSVGHAFKTDLCPNKKKHEILEE